MKRRDIAGKRFGRLFVISYIGSDENYRCMYLCRCDCGEEVVVWSDNLNRGRTKSCGCYHIERVKQTNTKHGLANWKNSKIQCREYSTWQAMKARCLNENNKRYNDYGGRGIRICERWKDSFENFYKDMGKKPKGMTLERINNDGNYEPLNCKWATMKEQANNKRKKVIVYV